MIFTFINLMLCFGLLGQENIRDEKLVKLGIESGIGFNMLIEENDGIGNFQYGNEGIYFGAVIKYIPQNSLLGFVSGIRYQRKGNESVHSDYLLIPLELEFILLKEKPINFLLDVGTAIEINLNDKKPKLQDIQRIGLNWRLGGGISLFSGKRNEFLIQCLRTISSKSYTGKGNSPGGAIYEVTTRNSGFEFGIKWIKRI